jgi:hypothetical protein
MSFTAVFIIFYFETSVKTFLSLYLSAATAEDLEIATGIRSSLAVWLKY